MSKLISRLKERLSEIAHSVLVWCLLHNVGTWHERIGAHADWEQVTYGVLSLSVEHCHCVDCCNVRLGIGPAAYAFNVGNDPVYVSGLTFSHWKAKPLDQGPPLAAPRTVGARLVDAEALPRPLVV